MKDQYVARRGGVMKAFDTEAEAVEFSDHDQTIALYRETAQGELSFVRVVGVKTADPSILFTGRKG
jgi:hypothetical protein